MASRRTLHLVSTSPPPPVPVDATRAVADHAMALLLEMAARLDLDLGGRTVGIVGYGRVGSIVAELARDVGIRVLAIDVDPAAVSRGRRAGVPMVDLPALVSASEAVVVCASHPSGFPPILDRSLLRLVPKGALVVNLAGPAVVDADAAAAAVRAGRLRGYAVDDAGLEVARRA